MAWIAAGLTAFAASGFIGLEVRNARLAAAGLRFLSPETALDRAIPLEPGWVWIYLSYYLLCFLPLLAPGALRILPRVALAYAVEFAAAFVCFVFVPMRMLRPEIPGASASAAALRWVYSVDPGYNIFPSLHVANVVMIALLFQRLRGGRPAALLWLWVGAVCASTLLVKQHYVVDVAAGVALALLADRVAWRGFAPAAAAGRSPAQDWAGGKTPGA